MSADGCHWPLSGAWSRFGSDGKALGKARAQSGKYFSIFETNFMKIFSTPNAEKNRESLIIGLKIEVFPSFSYLYGEKIRSFLEFLRFRGFLPQSWHY